MRAQARFGELRAIGLTQIEQHIFRRRLVPRRHHIQPLNGIGLIASAKLIKPLLRIGKLRMKLDGHIRPDFVAASSNRRADRGEQVRGLGAELHLHPADGFDNDALKRSSPPRMHSRNSALLGIHKKNGDTIRGLDTKQQSRTLGCRSVATAWLRGRCVKQLNHIGMDLFQRNELEITRAKRRLKPPAVFEHVFPAIPLRKTKIQNFFTLERAHTTRPSAEAVNKPRKFGERPHLQHPDTALRALGPFAVAFCRRALLACDAFWRECFRGSHNSTSIIVAGPGAESVSEGSVLIIGMGVDIAEVQRIQAAIERHGEPFLRRVYTPREREYCEQFRNKYERYAGRFAAKEAAMKALGTGWRRGVRWVDLEVVREASGRPTLALSGEAGKIAQQLGVKNIALSITHTETQALAQVIFES